MKNRTIAIIDEDKKCLGELEEVLAASGYTPVLIQDTRLALNIISHRGPDVILLELKMSRKNGFEIAHEINRVFESKRIPMIAMSESFKDEFGFLLNLCGINRCLKKPLNPMNVIWEIESATRQREKINAGQIESLSRAELIRA